MKNLEIDHRKPGPPYEILVVVGAILVAVALYGALFLDPTRFSSTSQTFVARLQFVSTRLYLVPFVNHPATVALVLLVLGYSLNAYGLLRHRFSNPKVERLACFYVPAGAALSSFIGLFAIRSGVLTGASWTRYHAAELTALLLPAVITASVSAFVLRRSHLSIRDLTRHPDAYDLSDLSGAARPPELAELCVKSSTRPAPGTLPGRICLGRLSDEGRPTDLWVAPHVDLLQQSLVLAPTGSGKTTSLCVPWSAELPALGQSVFALDFKGDLAPTIQAKFHGATTRLSVFNPLSPESVHWNPFSEIRPDDSDHEETLDAVAESIFGEVNHDQYQYFDLVDLRILKAAVRLTAASDAPSLQGLHDLFLSEAALQESLEAAGARLSTREQARIGADLSAVTDSRKYSFAERIQGVRNKLDAFSRAAIHGVTGPGSSFSLLSLHRPGTCLVFAAPLRLGLSGQTLAAMAVRLLQHHLHLRYGHTGPRLFLVLDEFSKLLMDAGQIERFISVCRSGGTVALIVLQDLTQIQMKARDSILGNCRDRYILHGASPTIAEWFSRSLGNRRRIHSSLSDSQSESLRNATGTLGASISEEWVPVLRPREVTTTGGLKYGAWIVLDHYSSKPILVDMAL